MRPLIVVGRAGLRGVDATATGTQSLTVPANTVVPTINDTTPAIGNVLTVTTGTWDGSATLSYTYQWQRGTTNRTGETASSYTVVAGDDTFTLRCVVTATNPVGVTSVNTANTSVVAAYAVPVNTVVPTIDDTTPLQGETLTAATGTWTGYPTPTYTYQWQHGTTNIGGATSSTYVVGADYPGETLRVQVTGTNSEGAATANSANTAAVATLPVNTVVPTIDDTTPIDGQTLSVTTGTWTGTPTPTYTYQWQHTTTNIVGATNSTYVVAVAYVGETLRCVVTATNSAGAVAANTANTSVVAASTVYATFNPSEKSASVTLSNGNLTASGSNKTDAWGNMGKSSGKWYWEYAPNTVFASVGITITGQGHDVYIGENSAGWGYRGSSSSIMQDGTTRQSGLASYGAGDIIGIALNMTDNQVSFYKNNALQGIAQAIDAGTWYPAVSGVNGGGAWSTTANFGASALTYTPPSGFNSGLYT